MATESIEKIPLIAEGVQLLLKRMESNPEEFDSYAGKWADIISAVESRVFNNARTVTYLTDYECDLIWDTYREMKRQRLHHDVMERILDKDRVSTNRTQFYRPVVPTVAEIVRSKLNENNLP